MAEQKRVAVVGDMFADMVTQVHAFPAKGDGTYGTAPRRNGGGTAGNVAAGLQMLSVDTAILCCLGDDEIGRYLKNDLASLGVDTQGIVLDPDAPSGWVLIAVDPAGERTIWVLAKNSAYEKLSPEDVRVLERLWPAAIYLTGFVLGAHPIEEALFAVTERWRGRAKLYFDPNLRYPADAVPLEVSAAVAKLSGLCDVVLTGEEEMRALGLSPAPGQTFVVKCGKNGSYLLGDRGEKRLHVPATKQVAVDATGAGDTFAAAFIAAEMDGQSVEKAMVYATAAAGISVTRAGARGTPSRREVEAFLANHVSERGI